MKLTLIVPASGPWMARKADGEKNGRWFRFSLLSVLSVAAVTPPDWEIEILDEQVDDIDFDAPRDLVGITAMTATAPRAYQLAGQFRRRGVSVVLGGYHPTFLPDEAERHADAVVVGEAEPVWPRLLADFQAGRMLRRYQADAPVDLATLPPLPRSLASGKGGYVTLNTVQATRGCPHRCDFCSIAAFHRGYRRRPAEHVAAEIAALPGRFIIFVDDNLCVHRGWTRELFRALAPLRKQWVTQTTLAFADDPELVELAAQAGCKGVFVGLESICRDSLLGVNKGFNHVERFRKQIAALHRAGIGVETGLVVGLDGDGPDVFERLLEFTDEAAIDAIQLAICTPLPGTPLFARMQAEGRIVDRDWSHYDYRNVVFQPKGMSRGELQAGADWLISEFYTRRRIAMRTLRALPQLGLSGTLRFSLPLNLAYRERVRTFGIDRRALAPALEEAPAV